MRYFIAAVGLAFAVASGSVAFAADGWRTQQNGYGQYHVSNAAAPGRSTQHNGYGHYHVSNGS